MSEKKYRVNDIVKYSYSDISEYIDENHTDRPLRNDIVVDLLNKQEERIKELEQEVETLQDQLAHGVSDLCGDVE